ADLLQHLALLDDALLEQALHERAENLVEIGSMRPRKEVFSHVERGWKAILAPLRQRVHADRREAAVDADERRNRLVEDRLHDRELRSALVQALAREQLVEDDTEREDVGTTIELLAPAVLGRHVRELAFEHARLGAGDAVGGLGDAEVEEL